MKTKKSIRKNSQVEVVSETHPARSQDSNDLGYLNPEGGFLYSEPIGMPEIGNTDFMFR